MPVGSSLQQNEPIRNPVSGTIPLRQCQRIGRYICGVDSGLRQRLSDTNANRAATCANVGDERLGHIVASRWAERMATIAAFAAEQIKCLLNKQFRFRPGDKHSPAYRKLQPHELFLADDIGNGFTLLTA